MKADKTLKIVYTALFSALTFVATNFIRVPLAFGYFNLGDTFVMLSAAILAGPYAVMAAVVGSVLADLIAGYAVYVPATIIIKSLVVVILSAVLKFDKTKNNLKRLPVLALGVILSESIMVLGYFAYDIILYGIQAATLAVFGNILQGVAACVTTVVIIMLLNKSGIMKQIK